MVRQKDLLPAKQRQPSLEPGDLGWNNAWCRIRTRDSELFIVADVRAENNPRIYTRNLDFQEWSQGRKNERSSDMDHLAFKVPQRQGIPNLAQSVLGLEDDHVYRMTDRRFKLGVSVL